MKLIPKYVWRILQYHKIVFFISLLIYAFEMIIVFPKVRDIIRAGPLKQCVHICLSTFLLINVCGNIVMNIISKIAPTDVVSENSVYCEFCQAWRPFNSWHCKRCNACILRRDHHCSFFSRCIGQGNKRYYILFLAYVSISMWYAAYYNYYWIASKYEDAYGPILTIARFINPLLRYLTIQQGGEKEFSVAYLCLNIAFAIWAGGLFIYHFTNAVNGVTAHEAKHYPELKNNSKWKQNLVNVFGIKWYWAILWPFCSSPLPESVKIEAKMRQKYT